MLLKNRFTLWYYSASALYSFGCSEEVEIIVDTSIPLALQSDRFDPIILEYSPTNSPITGGDDWYICKVLDGWGCGDLDEETVVYTYYRPL
jgi:hypothetical protein